MSFTILSQDTYKDESGNDIPASTITRLAPYRYVIDGFYLWQCAACFVEHSTRSCGWMIAGQNSECPKCGAMNLLVRTDCTEIGNMTKRINELMAAMREEMRKKVSVPNTESKKTEDTVKELKKKVAELTNLLGKL